VLQAVNLKALAAFIAKIAILPFRFQATGQPDWNGLKWER
jgi:hypothetical protein